MTVAESAVNDGYHEAAFRWFDDCMRARKERDEARAEVERLRERLEASAYEMARDMEPELVDGVVRAAYQRGAEAMREAAVVACAGVRSAAAVDHWIWAGCREGCVDAIRALPVPEDKP